MADSAPFATDVLGVQDYRLIITVGDYCTCKLNEPARAPVRLRSCYTRLVP